MKPNNENLEMLAKLARQFEHKLLMEPLVEHIQNSTPTSVDAAPLDVEEISLSDNEQQQLEGVKEALRLLNQARQDQKQFEGQAWKTATENVAEIPTVDDELTRRKLSFDQQDVSFQDIGRYEIIRPIADGGFARVFLARDPALDREVALKVPKPDVLVSDEARVRFQREARAAAMLSHPSIVPVFEAGNDGPIFWIASEYCDGSTLSEWIKGRGNENIDLQESVAIMAELASAIQHAHMRGILHRDLKPDNILLKTGDGDVSERIQVTDFGLACHLDSTDATLTIAGAIMGTPAYMSPEQARGDHDLTAQTDVFSLGVIFYELLTGQRPFVKSTHIATLKAIELEQPLSPRKINNRLPRDLEAVCEKALSKEMSTRYATAHELAEDLNRWREGKPVVARRITRWQRVLRWSRRNPLPAGAISFAACSLMVGFSIAFWQWSNSSRSSAMAESQSNRASGHLGRIAVIVDNLLGEIENSVHAGQLTDQQRTRLNDILKIQEELIVDEADDPASLRNTMRAYTNVTRIHLVLGENVKCQDIAAKGQKWLEDFEGWERGSADIDREMLGLIIDMQLDHVQSCCESNRGEEGIKTVEWLDWMLDQYSFLATEREILYYRLQFANHRGLALRSANQPDASLKEHVRAQGIGETLVEIGDLNRDEIVAIASNLGDLADRLASQFQNTRAETASAEAAVILEIGSESYPDDLKIRELKGTNHNYWALTLRQLKKAENAMTQIDLAIGEFEELVRIVPNNLSYIESLALALRRKSRILRRTGRFDEALAVIDEAIGLEDDGLGHSLQGKGLLVSLWFVQARILRSQGNRDGCLESAKKAIELGDAAFADHPELLDWRVFVNGARFELLYVHLKNGDIEEFVDVANDALLEVETLLLFDPSPRRFHNLIRGQVWALTQNSKQLGQLGRWADAIEAAEAILHVEYERSANGKQRYLEVAALFGDLSKQMANCEEPDEVALDSLQQKCLDHLESALRINGIESSAVFDRPAWNAVRKLPRFQALVDQFE